MNDDANVAWAELNKLCKLCLNSQQNILEGQDPIDNVNIKHP